MAAGSRHPFAYPDRPHLRRHRPPVFSTYLPYKPWLRDEFVFTCVYCLSRETWFQSHAFLGVEHYHPKSRPDEGVDVHRYANLLYACNECNRIKLAQLLPDGLHPEENPYGRHLKINRDGTLAWDASDEKVDKLVKILRLDRKELNAWRLKHYNLYEMTAQRPDDPVLRKRHAERRYAR